MRSPSKVVAVTPAAIEIEKRAIEREKKGQFRIAAHLWLQCMDVASGDVERARIRFAGTNVSQKVTAFAVATIAA